MKSVLRPICADLTSDPMFVQGGARFPFGSVYHLTQPQLDSAAALLLRRLASQKHQTGRVDASSPRLPRFWKLLQFFCRWELILAGIS